MRYATFAPKSRFNDAKSAISQPMKITPWLGGQEGLEPGLLKHIFNVERHKLSRSIDEDQCSVTPFSRVNCGHPGITAEQCIAKDCCYNDMDYDAIWCFYPHPNEDVVRVQSVTPKVTGTKSGPTGPWHRTSPERALQSGTIPYTGTVRRQAQGKLVPRRPGPGIGSRKRKQGETRGKTEREEGDGKPG
ncbi:unnamed protein product [Ranitomeya imitator]|uniref:P-type domain-containing protein n=1 Tax=Ranitomeya imitator TaxID=111125 RepID=A0ABN9M6S3_9NEOB|nr:unnamed protein product [Ranitomeya imitator]